jgi:uroporphyrinogen III methyltransferase/synthase
VDRHDESATVYLVGAGPGDPLLVTRRALELIARADVIVRDRLVPGELMSEARPDAEVLYAGKRPGADSISQEEINRLLIDRARAGRVVVRLKGGDPFVFGRGGEEAEALAEANVPFEVVPGVTAGVAAPAYAGIPITHRDQASAVAFVTGHEDPGKDGSSLDWKALAAFPGTLVFYMGVRNLDLLAERLIEHGRSAGEPAAVVERGSLPGQRTIVGPLQAIAELAVARGLRPPAITVVGPVASLRERLAWLERRPLHSRRVVVTRARAQASSLVERLTELGADVIEAPAIRIVPRRDDPEIGAAIRRLADSYYDIVCLTSSNGARLLVDAVAQEGLDARALAGTTIAAIGPGTADALRERGLTPDLVPERSVAEELSAALVERGIDGKRVLVARAAEAREVLPETLALGGADVDVVALYDTVQEQLDAEQLNRIAEADYVTFTSSSTVRRFVDAIGGVERWPRRARIVSIGPITTETARELGLRVDLEAARHDIRGLVDALVEDAHIQPMTTEHVSE